MVNNNVFAYEVFENGVSIYNANVRSLFLDSRNTQTTYTYRIDALDEDGNILARSNQVEVTTY